MDLSTIIGILSGVGLILLAILQKNTPLVFVDSSSFLIVCGGTFASTLISYSFKSMFLTFQDILKTFRSHKIDFHHTIKQLINYSEVIKTNGHLALDSIKTKDTFMQKGINLIVDNIDPTTFKEIMVIERETMIARHRESWMVLEKMADIAPSWGLIGTLIGLVLMMLELNSPDQIGRGMSVALLTTFYGALLSNIIFSPLATKIDNRSRKDAIHYDLIIEGLDGVLLRKHPRMIKEKLMGYLYPQDKTENRKFIK